MEEQQQEFNKMPMTGIKVVALASLIIMIYVMGAIINSGDYILSLNSMSLAAGICWRMLEIFLQMSVALIVLSICAGWIKPATVGYIIGKLYKLLCQKVPKKKRKKTFIKKNKEAVEIKEADIFIIDEMDTFENDIEEHPNESEMTQYLK